MNLLQTIEITLTIPTKLQLTASMGSVMQGILMENIDTQYAAYLHHQSMQPYSQYCLFDKKSHLLKWRISVLKTEASKEILLPLMNLSGPIHVRNKHTYFSIKGKKLLCDTTYEKLALQYLTDNQPCIDKTLTYTFLTPTAFKRNNQYVVYPEMPLIIASLLHRWNAFADITSLNHDDILPLLLKYPLWTRNYELFMQPFSLERTKIPAFQGSLSFSSGKHEMAGKILCLLSNFAAYSGIGIKTAIGMGAVETRID